MAGDINIELGNSSPTPEVAKVLKPLRAKQKSNTSSAIDSKAKSLPQVQLPITPELQSTKMSTDIEADKEFQAGLVRDLQDSEGFGVKLGAVGRTMLIGNAAFQFSHMNPHLEKDPSFDYYSRRAEFETGLQDWQVEEMRTEGGVLNEANAVAMREKFIEQNLMDGVVSRTSMPAVLGLGLLAGAPEIVLFGAPFRAASILGNQVRNSKLLAGAGGGYVAPAAGYATEGAVIGAGYTAALDAMGEHYNLDGYLHGITLGAALNVGFSGAFRGFKEKPAVAPEESFNAYANYHDSFDPAMMDTLLATTHESPEAALQSILERNTDYTVGLYRRAVENTGSTDKLVIQAEVVRLQAKDLADLTANRNPPEAPTGTADEGMQNISNSLGDLENAMKGTDEAIADLQKSLDDLLESRGIAKEPTPKQSAFDDLLDPEAQRLQETLRKATPEPEPTAPIDKRKAAKLERKAQEEAKLARDPKHQKALENARIERAAKLKEAERARAAEEIAAAKAKETQAAEAKHAEAWAALKAKAEVDQGALDAVRELERKAKEAKAAQVEAEVGTVEGTPVAKAIEAIRNEEPLTPEQTETLAKLSDAVAALEKEGLLTPEQVTMLQEATAKIRKIKDEPEVKTREELDSIGMSKDLQRIRKDPAFTQAVDEGLIGNKVDKGHAGSLTVAQGSGKALALNIKTTAKDTIPALQHEMGHLRVAALTKTLKQYLEFVRAATAYRPFDVLHEHFMKTWEPFRTSSKAYFIQQGHNPKVAEQLADASIMEEIMVEAYSAYKSPEGFHAAMEQRYGIVIPKSADTALARVKTALNAWMAKAFPSLFQKGMSTEQFLAHLKLLDELGSNLELLTAMKEGKIASVLYGSKGKDSAGGIDIPSMKPSTAKGKAIDKERIIRERVTLLHYRQAVEHMKNVIIEPAKLIRSMQGVDYLISFGMKMIRDKNPLVQALASKLLEITTGAGGRNNMSASLVTEGRRHVYLQKVGNNVERELYDVWAAQQPSYSFVEGMWHGKLRREWNELLTEARLWEDPKGRNIADRPAFPEEINTAAKLYEKGYQYMGDDQRLYKTQGFERIPEQSTGYFPRAISSEAYAAASVEEIAIVQGILKERFVNIWGIENEKLAASIAKRYMEQAAGKLYGNTHSMSPQGITNVSLVEQLLAELNVPQATRAQLLGRLGEGGAKHTKQRLDLDLLQTYTLSDGTTKKLFQFFDTDQAALYQQYARRVSGEVGLRTVGIMGEKHIKQILDDISINAPAHLRVSDDVYNAVESIFSEFLGKPIGAQNLVLDNLRVAAGANLLGSALFPQLSETFTMLTHFGIGAVLKALPEMRKIREDIKLGRESTDPVLKDVEAEVGIFGYDYDVMTPYIDQSFSNINTQNTGGRVTRMIRAAGRANKVWSFYHALHSTQQRLSAKLAISQTFQRLNKLTAEGKPIESFFDDIKGKLIGDMGFTDNPQLLAKLQAEMPNIATFDSAGNLKALDFRKAADSSIIKEFSNVILRGVGQVITDTRIGERSRAHHSAWAKAALQFRAIAVTGIEKQQVRQFNTVGGMRFAGLLLGAFSFAFPLYYAKVQSRSALMGTEDRKEYLEKALSTGAISHAVLQYAIAAGVTADIMDIGGSIASSALANVETDDGTSVGAQLEKTLGLDSQQRGITNAIPLIGYANNSAKAFENLLSNGDFAGVMKQLPAANIWQVAPAWTALSQDMRKSDEEE